jgi:uncharacterized protein involved in type VI secretion and phage assembly
MKRMPGVVVAIVRSLDDPRGEGRIQLEFPWLAESETSSWAPIAAPMAGSKRGAFFMPEVDDEVLVAFEHGDFEHPFVVGFLWNGADKPPETDPKNRVILTPGGHTVRLEDGTNKKLIVRSSSGHEIALDDSPGGQQLSIKTKGGLSFTMDDKLSSIRMQGGGRILAMQNGQLQIL